jgi:hypothetical protein
MLDTLLSLWDTFGPLITGCITNEGEERTARNLKRFGPLVEWRVRRTGTKRGMSGDELDEFVSEARAAARSASDEELRDFVAAAKQHAEQQAEQQATQPQEG